MEATRLENKASRASVRAPLRSRIQRINRLMARDYLSTRKGRQEREENRVGVDFVNLPQSGVNLKCRANGKLRLRLGS
jgi:hypothetical protein